MHTNNFKRQFSEILKKKQNADKNKMHTNNFKRQFSEILKKNRMLTKVKCAPKILTGENEVEKLDYNEIE